ncbi:MAG: SiaB family protein kinase [Microscillaceae bacterium]|jgi:hypothetical protein|nr:SiaB family protein kinase [Microscillaceae bacterium]
MGRPRKSKIVAKWAYEAQTDTEVLFSYKGPVNHALIADLSNSLRTLLADNQRIRRKVVSVFIELAQNIIYYSAETSKYNRVDKVGLILFQESPESFWLSMGNMVEEKSIAVLQERHEKINGFDEEGLRRYRLELVENTDNELSKGAGIGLVKVALTSQNPIEMKIETLEENRSFYIITVKFDK